MQSGLREILFQKLNFNLEKVFGKFLYLLFLEEFKVFTRSLNGLIDMSNYDYRPVKIIKRISCD